MKNVLCVQLNQPISLCSPFLTQLLQLVCFGFRVFLKLKQYGFYNDFAYLNRNWIRNATGQEISN
jgi:hypothetical protein